MRGKTYTSKDKEGVKQLLLAGKSYKEIDGVLGIPKSTVSTWFGKTLKRPINKQARLDHLFRIRKLARIAIKNKWNKRRQEEDRLIKNTVERDIKNYPLENIGFYKSLLSMLYWAEGSKHEKVSGLQFANTDFKLSLLYITLLRKCYNIDEDKFRIKLHLHYYHPIKKIRKFWSDTLRVPLNQFNKIYIKKRSKTKRFRKNFAGICFIHYSSNIIRKELLELGLVLQKNIK